ncbi:hypothetical protein [Kitasatospora sp. NPDC085464]|uniref:hypothetical protein n=1 Tax=Kitasatospora sp. NPDC085464 TaxID=3364063 RepID=UPI0037CBF92E
MLELTEKAGPDRLECPQCAADREEQELGPLVLPVPTKRERVTALVSAPDDPWWEEGAARRALPGEGPRLVSTWACHGVVAAGAPRPVLRRVLELTEADSLFPVFATAAQAARVHARSNGPDHDYAQPGPRDVEAV